MRIDGHVEPAFWPLVRTLERQIRRHRGGAALCVYHRGRMVVDVWGGRRDEQGGSWRQDTLAMSFSTTKGVTATALHVLADRGLLDYDDPVAQHWPEFAQAGKERITVRQLLCHQAGLHHLRRLIRHGEEMLEWDHMVRLLERAEPAYTPGEHTAYHGLTFGWLVGELVQRVAGRPFSQVIQEELAAPLGLEGLFVGAPAEARVRAAVLRRPPERHGHPERWRWLARGISHANRALGIPFDPSFLADALIPREGADVFWHPRILEAPIPAANGLFSARSLARLYAALAGGGELDGVRLLSERTLRRASEIQCRRLDRVVPVRMLWRLGWHRAFTLRGRAPRAFGHFGYGGSGGWADPGRELAVAMINNTAGGSPFGDLRMAQLGGTAIACADGVAAELAS